ncbi:MAG: divergent PAP2 family protein [Bacilli bacterium]|nr:divergent PAP2 family protein [Bacilli bacterium]
MKYIFLICPLVSLAVCQLLKIFVAILKKKEITLSLITSSGGMPSAHSCFVSSLVTIIGLVEGVDSSFFAISLVFGLITCYDASHIRRESGMHAKLLNEKFNMKLNINLGHELKEVIAGIITGMLVTLIIYFL